MRGAYSEDLRQAVVSAVGRGIKRAVVLETFGVSRATVKRWLKQQRELGHLARKPVPGAPAVKTQGLPAALPERLASHNDATLAEHCAWWQARSGFTVSEATMCRAIQRLGWTRKKRR